LKSGKDEPAVGSAPAPQAGAAAIPDVRAPPGLGAWRVDVAGDAFALFEIPADAPVAQPRFGPSLTPAEGEIARMLAAGFSNAEIGRCRGTSVRTIANQIASIFDKLGVRSRFALCAVAAKAPLDGGAPY
jgi:DNA-binding CsgD family transcriptional regulator